MLAAMCNSFQGAVFRKFQAAEDKGAVQLASD